jgi:acyl dehydratase
MATVTSVGDQASRTHRVERDDIRRFTEMTGDRDPVHYDEEVARRSRFGRMTRARAAPNRSIAASAAARAPTRW